MVDSHKTQMPQALPDFRPLEGKYEILRKLGEGGMGDIYLVRHKLLEELRVVKVMQPQLREATAFRERFLREARTAIQLRHPNLAQLYDFSVDEDGTAYMILEFIEGCTVEDLIGIPQFSSLRLQIEIAQQALRAVGFLHRRGFVHRDISPDNLMLSQDADGHPLVKLLDLGIVKPLDSSEKLTGTATFMGKYMYASPEQLEAKEVDARSDIYSMGVVLYQMLTGHYPIQGGDMRSILVGHLFQPPLSFDRSDKDGRLPAELRRTILGALEKKPSKRIQTAEDFASRLAAIALPKEPGGAMLSGKALANFIDRSSPKKPGVDSAQVRIDEHFQKGDRTPAVTPTLLEQDDRKEEQNQRVRLPRVDEQRDVGQRAFGANAEHARAQQAALQSAAQVEEARALFERGDLESAQEQLNEAERLGALQEAGRELSRLLRERFASRDAAVREAAAAEVAAREDAAREAAARELAAREAAAREIAARDQVARESVAREATARAAAAREAASREAEARATAAKEAADRKAAADEVAAREASIREKKARETAERQAGAHLDSRVESLERLLSQGELGSIRTELRKLRASKEAKQAEGSSASMRLAAFAARYEAAAASQARARPQSRLRMAAVGAGVILAAVVIWWGLSRPTEAPGAAHAGRSAESTAAQALSPAVVSETRPSTLPSVPAVTGFLRITSEPWAFVESIRRIGGSGGEAPLEKRQASPLGITLSPGTYEVTLRDAATGKIVVRRVEVAPGGTARLHERFSPVDVEKYFAQEADAR